MLFTLFIALLQQSKEIPRLEWNEWWDSSQSTFTQLIFRCDFLLAIQ
jgi:hypothetical protein